VSGTLRIPSSVTASRMATSPSFRHCQSAASACRWMIQVTHRTNTPRSRTSEPQQPYLAYDGDDGDHRAMPVPGGAGVEEEDAAVREFIEREQPRQKAAEDAAKPQALKRDEYMLLPPSFSYTLGADPLKLKARQFSGKNPKSKDDSLWTDTYRTATRHCRRRARSRRW